MSTKTERENTLKYYAAYERMMKECPFLFTHGNEFIPTDEYFKGMFFTTHQFLTRFAAPWAYRLGVLQQFKENIVWTATLPTASGDRVLVSLIQANPQLHFVVTFAYISDEGEMMVSPEVWAYNPADIHKFFEDNMKFVCKPSLDLISGFESRAHHSHVNS